MKLLLSLALLSFALHSIGLSQNSSRQTGTTGRGSRTIGGAGASGAASKIKQAIASKNYSITVKGEYIKGVPIDVTLTGIGLEYRATLPPALSEDEATPPTTGQLEFKVHEQTGKLIVNYSIGIRYPIKTGKNVSFAEALIEGTVRCTPGNAIEVFKSGGSNISITVNETKEEK